MGDKSNVYLVVLCVLATLAAPAAGRVRGSGWLGQLVQYYKNEFFEDLVNITPSVDVQAKLTRAPPGYSDSEEWDAASVVRLLYLMHLSPSSRPALAAVRRMLSPPTRRFLVPEFISKQLSYKLFPSLNESVYYDGSGGDYDGEIDDPWRVKNITDDTIIVVLNPVEARLPSSHISAKKLREILEGRAKAARMMPVVTRFTIPHISISTTPAKKTTTKKAVTTTPKPDDGGHTTPTSDKTGGDDVKTTGGGNNDVTTAAARRHRQRARTFRPSSFKPPRRFVGIKPKAKRKSLLRKIFKG